ncbi:hypothetical protein [Cereibacter sphaeroides]|jgi:hypothetical protein|uniref:hypothetical protein n=1 Tax=Cereibacter sphaeroides TaxID=1063 RepID=UPI0000663F97|nr:hypothetical protein Rsph17029_0647 [Cereibacter sphaeroides ATCC 17029]
MTATTTIRLDYTATRKHYEGMSADMACEQLEMDLSQDGINTSVLCGSLGFIFDVPTDNLLDCCKSLAAMGLIS